MRNKDYVIETAKNDGEYTEKVKNCKYVANMTKNKKVVHLTGEDACYQSKTLYNFLKINSIDEALEFEPRLSFCQKCFPSQKELRIGNELNN